MRITMQLSYRTPDSEEAVAQTVDAFEVSLAQACAYEAPFEKIGELAFRFGVAHPAKPPPGKGRASYARSSGKFFCGGYLGYGAWLGGQWAKRVEAVAEATQAALAAVHKTRLTSDERSKLVKLIAASAEKLIASPPDQLLALLSIYVCEDSSGRWTSISYRQPSHSMTAAFDSHVRVLQPWEIATYFDQQGHGSKGVATAKLFKSIDGKLHYRQAWVDGDSVVEHSGVCGELGSVLDYAVIGQVQQQKMIDKISVDSSAEGFKPIPATRLKGLLVIKEIQGLGTPGDLQRLHALEDFLNGVTAWRGLGHCDGGSIGSGSMEAFCLVVDYGVAAKAIEHELANSQFSDFVVSRIPGEGQGPGRAAVQIDLDA